MKRFLKLFGAGATSFGLLYKPVLKAFAIDESAEGIELEKSSDSIHHNIFDMTLFSVTRERDLAKDIALNFNTRLGKIQVSQNGVGDETQIKIMESIRGKRVYLVCSFDLTRWSFNETLVDLFLTVAAMKRNSPVEVNVVLPYYAYGRQNAPDSPHRKSLFASDVASFLEAAGADKVFTVNLPAQQIHGVFNIPLLEVDVIGVCASYYKKHTFKDLVVVCANDRLFPQALKLQVALVKAGHKVEVGLLAEQLSQSEGKFKYIGKELKGRDVLIIDNVIDTGITTYEVSNYLNDLGANEIYMFATHGILSEGAIERVNESKLKELVITNTLPLHMSKFSPKINQVSIAPMLAETIAQNAFNKRLEKIKEDVLIPGLNWEAF